MSEYQSYEFLAIDRPLDLDAQKALRSISSRARITATSFTNQYQWGDLKGDPRKFMERWFDLHVYSADWGTRRLMLRLPAQATIRRCACFAIFTCLPKKSEARRISVGASPRSACGMRKRANSSSG
jgi:hypothetical protein